MSFDIAAYKKQHGTHDLEVVIAPDGGIALCDSVSSGVP